MKITSKTLLFILFLLQSFMVYSQYYVKDQFTGNGSGSDWNNAISYSALSDIINSSTNRNSINIKLYQGTYLINKKIDLSNYGSVQIIGNYVYEIDPETGSWFEYTSGDPTKTIIDAQNLTNFFKFSNNTLLNLENFTLQNGTTSTDLSSVLFINNSPNLTFIVKNVTFKNNNLTSSNALYIDNIKEIDFDFLEFIGNKATAYTISNGSALSISNVKKVNITNSIFKDNRSYNNGAALNLKNINDIRIEQISGNTVNTPTYINFENNFSSNNGGAIYLDTSRLNATALYFQDNISGENGGGIYLSPSSEALINRTHFIGNKSKKGGGIYNDSNSKLKIISTLFHHNSAIDLAGAIYNKNNIAITNATFVRNINSSIVFAENSSNSVYNSIFYSDESKSLDYKKDLTPEISGSSNYTNNIRNNITEDFISVNNLNANPLFVNDNNDFNLQITSPAFNTGKEDLFQSVTGAATSTYHDIVKRNRNYGLSIDMGAYELTFDIEDFFPDCPNISSPTNLETDVELRPTIIWGQVRNATQYKLTIFEENIANSIYTTNVLRGTDPINVSFDLPIDLKPNTNYQVYIFPENTLTGVRKDRCPSINFKTKKIPTIPNCTTISSPFNEEKNISLTPTITWNKVEDATNYQLIIGTSQDGIEILNINVGNITSYKLTNALNHSTKYFVKVIAINNIGSAVNCLSSTFYTLIPPNPCDTVKLSLSISKDVVTVNILNGNTPILYKIDNGDWKNTNTFYDVTKGLHQIEIKTVENCIKSIEFEIPNFYNLITPNNDGKNDQIDFSFLKSKQNASLLIIDRYGKTVFKDQGENQFIWKGKQLNGMTLPTNTYWYFIEWKEINNEIINKLQGWILLKNK